MRYTYPPGVPCALPAQMYDSAVALWQLLRAKLEEGLALAGISSKDVWKTFWSAQQRFFKLLCVSLKVRGRAGTVPQPAGSWHSVQYGTATGAVLRPFRMRWGATGAAESAHGSALLTAPWHGCCRCRVWWLRPRRR